MAAEGDWEETVVLDDEEELDDEQAPALPPQQPAQHPEPAQALQSGKEPEAKKRKVADKTILNWADPKQGGFTWVKFLKMPSGKEPARIQCHTCIAAKKNNVFTSKGGASVSSLTDLKRHHSHIKHIEAEKEADQRDMMVAQMQKATAEKKTAQEKEAVILLTIALMMAVLGISGWCFPHHVALVALPIIGALAANTPKRTHARYFWALIYAISEALLVAQLAAIMKSPYIAILMDSSTDISKDEHVLVYVQYLDMSTFQPVSQYLCTTSVRNKTAEAIYDQLVIILRTLDMDACRIAAFCSDGGSEYSGKNAGVAKRVKDTVTGWLVRVHCFAHRVALVMSDQLRAAVQFARSGSAGSYTLSDVDSILKDVHGLFAHSGKRKKTWAAFMRRQGVSLRAFPVFNTTRWLSRASCLDVLVENLPTLILFLECMERKRQRWGSDVLDRLKDPDFVVMIHIVCDIVNVVNAYNASVQADAMPLFEALSTLNDVVSRLNDLVVCHPTTKSPLSFANQRLQGRQVGPPHTLRFISQFNSNTGVWRYRPGRLVTLEVEQPDGWLGLGRTVEFAHSFVCSIVKSIEARFPQRTVLQGLKVLHPSTWIGVVHSDQLRREDWMPRECITAFRQLIELFSQGPHPIFTNIPSRSDQAGRNEAKGKYMRECDLFAKHMISVVKKTPGISFVDAWSVLLSQSIRGQSLFPNITQLFYITQVTPVHTACVERGFSIHRVLKNKLSNKLKLTTLDSLLRIKMLVSRAAWVTHDLSEAVSIYLAKHPRKEEPPTLLAKLHTAFNEAAQWPGCLADEGIAVFEETDLAGIDVSGDESDVDDSPVDDGEGDDDAEWDQSGLDLEPWAVGELAAEGAAAARAAVPAVGAVEPASDDIELGSDEHDL